jgi:hypothetical protein
MSTPQVDRLLTFEDDTQPLPLNPKFAALPSSVTKSSADTNVQFYQEQLACISSFKSSEEPVTCEMLSGMFADLSQAKYKFLAAMSAQKYLSSAAEDGLEVEVPAEELQQLEAQLDASKAMLGQNKSIVAAMNKELEMHLQALEELYQACTEAKALYERKLALLQQKKDMFSEQQAEREMQQQALMQASQAAAEASLVVKQQAAVKTQSHWDATLEQMASQLIGIEIVSMNAARASMEIRISTFVKGRSESVVLEILLSGSQFSARVLRFEGTFLASPGLLAIDDIVSDANKRSDVSYLVREVRQRFKCGILRKDILDALSTRWAVQGSPFEPYITVVFVSGATCVLHVPRDYPVFGKQRMTVAEVRMRGGKIETAKNNVKLAALNEDDRLGNDLTLFLSEVQKCC